MRSPRPWRGRLALAASATGAVLLGGCALIGSHPLPKAPVVVQPAPPPPAPTLAAPIDTHKFVLTDPSQDVIGQVQVTVASKSDTLLDIARRFNVGYEEIERANP